MMNIYFRDENLPKLDIITDVEREFDNLKLTGSFLENLVINKIELGSFKDALHFTDRFGDKLPINFMSTGCKAALVVLNNPDKLVDLKECGLNARDTIITYLDGNVLLTFSTITFYNENFHDKNNIKVCLDNYVFTNLDRLNYYLTDERPYVPDMSRKGIFMKR